MWFSNFQNTLWDFKLICFHEKFDKCVENEKYTDVCVGKHYFVKSIFNLTEKFKLKLFCPTLLCPSSYCVRGSFVLKLFCPPAILSSSYFVLKPFCPPLYCPPPLWFPWFCPDTMYTVGRRNCKLELSTLSEFTCQIIEVFRSLHLLIYSLTNILAPFLHYTEFLLH